jgi:hypothetical protein
MRCCLAAAALLASCGKGDSEKPAAPGAADSAKRDQCSRLIADLSLATEIYYTDMAIYPEDLTGSGSRSRRLSQSGSKRLPYFEFRASDRDGAGNILDPWGRPLQYRNNQNRSAADSDPSRRAGHNPNRFDLWSFGPDGKDDDGKGDDVANWK